MKKKFVFKIMIDCIMGVLFISMYFLTQTGLVFHEVFGLLLCVLVFIHLGLNQEWFKMIFKKGKKKTHRTKRAIGINVFLMIAIILILISGIMISVVLLPGLDIANRFVFVKIHKLTAYGAIAFLLVHLLLHLKYMQGMIKKIAQYRRTKAVRQVVVSTGALVVVVLMLYAAGTPILENLSLEQAAQTTQEPKSLAIAKASESTVIQKEAENDQQETVTATEGDSGQTVEESTAPVVSLNDYLSGLSCTGCSKHCPLIAPACAKGEAQAQVATQDYENLYGDSAQ